MLLTSGINHYGHRTDSLKFQFGDYVLWFLGVVSKNAPKFQRRRFKKTNVQGEGKPKDVAMDEDGFQPTQMG